MINKMIEKISMPLDKALFWLFKDTIERINGIRNPIGKNNEESPGNSFQTIGLSIAINTFRSIKITRLNIEIRLNILLLFSI